MNYKYSDAKPRKPVRRSPIAAVFTLIGFVWKISHKVSTLEKRLENERDMRMRDGKEYRRDIDMIINNVDKNREWTTSRMMSMVRDAPPR